MKLGTPLLKMKHLLDLPTVKTGATGKFIRSSDGLQFDITILFVMLIPANTKGLDESWMVPDVTNGIYSDGKNWYQLAWQKSSRVVQS